MAILFMLSWWYSKGWAWALDRIGHEIAAVGRIFAVKILLKTLFAPWKQITTPSTFQTFFQSLADNTVSRAVGFVIRSTILFIALLWTLFIVITGLLLVILWPLLPFSVVILPILYVIGLGG